MEIVNISIYDLIDYNDNPRNNDEAVDYVKASIKEFGFKVPIVVDSDYTIIAGHTRKKAALEIGIKEVPVIVADDLTPEQVTAFRLADNKVAEFSQWDEDLLMSELNLLDDMDMSDFGFDLDDTIEDVEIEEDDFDEEPPEDPIAEVGQIYQLGRHRVMCGDSTNENDVKKLTDNHKMDMVFTDPPYNADYASRVDKNRRKAWGGILNDKMTEDDFADFLIDVNAMIDMQLKDGGAIYECIDWKRYPQMAVIFNEVFNQKSMIVWNKNYFGLGTYYRTKHEIILFGIKGDKLNVWNAGHNEMDVWDLDRERNNNYQHPTQKPVTIPSRAINNSSNPNDKVLDLFGGSGSTLMACEQTNREAYLMELDPKYVDVIISRWEQYTGEGAVLINGKGQSVDDVEETKVK